MQKTPIALAFAAATTLGMSGTAMADRSDYEEAIDQSTFSNMIEQATAAGITSFRDLQVDEERGNPEFEADGWNREGWELELTLDGQSGDVIRESRNRTVVSPWGLSPQQLDSLLGRANSDGFERFDDIELDRDGTIEVSGYGSNQREMEHRYSIDEFNGNAQ
ncbi:PepSY domain-containing protein [Kushneria aurantia]|uniref:PepSY domain-containing protein n=1 Tax=Kushneria aurantia TaxID=504092 RepID=A0ABV6G075_9GAMM|nr:PepSY domain-containing protein [Kushneria aurantia]